MHLRRLDRLRYHILIFGSMVLFSIISFLNVRQVNHSGSVSIPENTFSRSCQFVVHVPVLPTKENWSPK